MSSGAFDRIARWYDRLAFGVFGNRLHLAEQHTLQYLPNEGRLLWVGGGTGKSLPDILHARPKLAIDYVDTSSRMLALSRARIESRDMSRIRFLDSLSPVLQEEYSVCLFSFVLDLFSETELSEKLDVWLSGLTSDGVILVADFFHPPPGFWKSVSRGLFPLMYQFFSLTTGLSHHCLPDWQRALANRELIETPVYESLGGMVRAGIWQRDSH